MHRDLILGTAGHIDHGKTSLVKALTGIDCDRLPEEKERGITIDIGFAHLELGDLRLGIVDVPGHERFIKNMLAGATGIDLALLVIAADDSVMPQTREHLEILKLLGLRRGVIALTKADLVDETTRQVVELEVRELVRDSFLSDALIVPVSAITGLGIDALKLALRDAANGVEPANKATWFRLPIDRAFVVQGHGTVVTGSVVTGSVRTGDELDWHRGDGRTERVRVRSLNTHGRGVEEIGRGQRAGANLAAVPHEAVHRGQELCTPGYLVPSRVITVRLLASKDQRKPLKHRLPVRVHVGTAELMSTISLLEGDQLRPGEWGLAQLFLEAPATTVWGQPFIIRDSSAKHTLGGGQVLQPQAGKVRRRHLEVIEQLERLSSPEPEVRAAVVAWFAGIRGATAPEIVRRAGISPEEVVKITGKLCAAGILVDFALSSHHRRLLHAGRLAAVEALILQLLSILHAESPLVSTHERQRALARLEYLGDEPFLQAVTDRLIASGKVVGDNRRFARADFKPKLSANQKKLKDKIVEAHRRGGFQPPGPQDFANQAGGNATALADLYEVAVAEGFLVKVTSDIYLDSTAEADMRQRLVEHLQEGKGMTVAEIKDLLGTTRKFAVPICEYLDRVGVTRREGDLRVKGPA